MKKCINLLLIIIGPSILFAQTRPSRPVGDWLPHFSYSQVKILETGNDMLFGASQNGLFFLEDNQLSILFKTQGLSDVRATSLLYDQGRELLVTGYESGIIDLVLPNEVVKISTLQTAEIISDRSINDLSTIEGGYFAATDLGLAFIDISINDIRDIYREIGPAGEAVKAVELEVNNNQVFLLTDLGVLTAELSDNLFDFNNWQLLINADTLTIEHLAMDGTDILVSSGNDLYEIRGAEQVMFLDSLTSDILLVESFDQKNYIVTQDSFLEYSEGIFTSLATGDFSGVVSMAFYENRFWFGTQNDGLIFLDQDQINSLPINGPKSDSIKRISDTGRNIALIYSSAEEGTYTSVYDLYNDGIWQNLSFDTPVLDIIDYGGNRFLGTTNGLYNANTDDFVSELGVDTITSLSIRNQWLWTSSIGINSASLFDGFSWFNYSSSITGSRYPVDIQISAQDIALLIRSRAENGGIAAFDPITSDSRRISVADGLPSNSIFDVDIANSDELWVTTTEGLVSFFDASFILEGDDANELFFQGGPLLGAQEIQATAFDGGDRKWIATRNGLWLFNNNLTEQLEHFTTENSPLPSDNVLDLTYRSITGELFIFTDKGLVSYQTDSSIPVETHSDVVIYPNPVLLSSGLSVALTGLAANGTVKITTPTGILVREIEANGSSASWDLRDYRGTQAKPGIYLLFSSDRDGEDTFIGKVAVIP